MATSVTTITLSPKEIEAILREHVSQKYNIKADSCVFLITSREEEGDWCNSYRVNEFNGACLEMKATVSES